MEECMEEKKGCTVVNQYYGCCDGNGNSGTGAEIVYSTEETVCGKWIDGKPIYRKVITGKLAKDSGNDILFANISDLKIDRLISLSGNTAHNNNTAQFAFPISFNNINALVAAVNMFYDTKREGICYHFLNCNGLYSGSEANVIIEYTKK